MERRIADRKAELAEKWGMLVLETYPVETQRIWKNNKNRFSNPVGATIRESTEELVDHLLTWENAEAICASLDKLIKIRGVQSFSPSQALSFVFLFKKLLRDEFFKEMQEKGELDVLLRFEAKVDNLMLMAVDILFKNQEQVYKMRVEELKRSQHTLLKKARMIVDVTTDKVEE
ncbi:RsbRD N-terminal domain-containing protein [Pseudodesulfovibrio senegalensis]|jgi:hypothetical protein|uniref:RsbT co-antagonist protein RsbRD N-terminal domain-containing protein n=1 Tax=Pseudodesulfovibrio senegalensis TaxID=1721087 RepID=A0A6N6N2Q5_9BACT|nr:RsbRD N-terminal domain-containing protein [Pseudodesulfovibrio senegalensis]KAB1441722.1 hypothetical protein F8A88_09000 [Pseudodesulfovibrio senegalensis]